MFCKTNSSVTCTYIGILSILLLFSSSILAFSLLKRAELEVEDDREVFIFDDRYAGNPGNIVGIALAFKRHAYIASVLRELRLALLLSEDLV